MKGWRLAKVGYAGRTALADASRAVNYPTIEKCQPFIVLHTNAKARGRCHFISTTH